MKCMHIVYEYYDISMKCMNVKNGHWGLLQLFWYTAHSPEMFPLHVFVLIKMVFCKFLALGSKLRTIF